MNIELYDVVYEKHIIFKNVNKDFLIKLGEFHKEQTGLASLYFDSMNVKFSGGSEFGLLSDDEYKSALLFLKQLNINICIEKVLE